MLASSSRRLDGLIRKMDELQQISDLYQGLMRHTHLVLQRIYELSQIHRCFGDAFANIGAREPQLKASLAFTQFGDAHRHIDRHAIHLLRTVKPVGISDVQSSALNSLRVLIYIDERLLDGGRSENISHESDPGYAVNDRKICRCKV